MKENLKVAMFASLFALIGIPLIFLGLSLYTENWLFFIYSIPPALTAGLTGLIHTRNRQRQLKESS